MQREQKVLVRENPRLHVEFHYLEIEFTKEYIRVNIEHIPGNSSLNGYVNQHI